MIVMTRNDVMIHVYVAHINNERVRSSERYNLKENSHGGVALR